MMLNYLKGEAYRIAHGRAAYLFAGTLCAIVLAANVLLWAMSSTPGFPYATVRFSMSNLVSMLPLLFYMAGLLVWVLFADDRKDGTLKNAIAHGCSRRDLFLGKCLVATVLGLAILAVVLAVASALPFTAACVVLGVAVCSALPKTVTAFLVWVAVVSVIPAVLNVIGLGVEPVARLASWLPANFFANEVAINQSGLAQFLWDTPEGLAKCLIAGIAGIAVFGAVGLWRAGKAEL